LLNKRSVLPHPREKQSESAQATLKLRMIWARNISISSLWKQKASDENILPEAFLLTACTPKMKDWKGDQ
jgi:hypothetical protein